VAGGGEAATRCGTTVCACRLRGSRPHTIREDERAIHLVVGDVAAAEDREVGAVEGVAHGAHANREGGVGGHGRPFVGWVGGIRQGDLRMHAPQKGYQQQARQQRAAAAAPCAKRAHGRRCRQTANGLRTKPAGYHCIVIQVSSALQREGVRMVAWFMYTHAKLHAGASEVPVDAASFKITFKAAAGSSPQEAHGRAPRPRQASCRNGGAHKRTIAHEVTQKLHWQQAATTSSRTRPQQEKESGGASTAPPPTAPTW